MAKREITFYIFLNNDNTSNYRQDACVRCACIPLGGEVGRLKSPTNQGLKSFVFKSGGSRWAST